jgi:hypothetical protein
MSQREFAMNSVSCTGLKSYNDLYRLKMMVYGFGIITEYRRKKGPSMTYPSGSFLHVAGRCLTNRSRDLYILDKHLRDLHSYCAGIL